MRKLLKCWVGLFLQNHCLNVTEGELTYYHLEYNLQAKSQA